MLLPGVELMPTRQTELCCNGPGGKSWSERSLKPKSMKAAIVNDDNSQKM